LAPAATKMEDADDFHGGIRYERRFDLPIKAIPLLPVGLFEVLQGDRLKSGERKMFNVFDPAPRRCAL
jgi:hypothetical protein